MPLRTLRLSRFRPVIELAPRRRHYSALTRPDVHAWTLITFVCYLSCRSKHTSADSVNEEAAKGAWQDTARATVTPGEQQYWECAGEYCMVKVNVVQIGSLVPRQMILLKDARSDSGGEKGRGPQMKEDSDGGWTWHHVTNHHNQSTSGRCDIRMGIRALFIPLGNLRDSTQPQTRQGAELSASRWPINLFLVIINHKSSSWTLVGLMC